jgi:hypothetical protein
MLTETPRADSGEKLMAPEPGTTLGTFEIVHQTRVHMEEKS